MKWFCIAFVLITLIGIVAARSLGGNIDLLKKMILGFVISVIVSFGISTDRINHSDKSDNIVELLKGEEMNNHVPMQMFAPFVTLMQLSPVVLQVWPAYCSKNPFSQDLQKHTRNVPALARGRPYIFEDSS